jgi:tetratricopeptide (TPR) repeat protein
MLEAPPVVEQSDKSSGIEGHNTLAPDLKPMECDMWPFNWAAVDVPGSPGLSRLFSALEIECSVPVPPMSLDTRVPEELQYISRAEMLDLWNESNKFLVYEPDVSCSPQLGLAPESPKGQTQAFPWRDPKLVFCGWLGSPLNEIYVFPTPSTKNHYRPPSPRKPLWAKLEAQAAELRVRLSKLKPLMGVEHPRILAIKEDLAEIYTSQGNYQKAEKLRWYVASAMRKSLGPTNLKTLVAWQKWVGSLLYQGQYLRGHTLLSKMHSAILKLVNPDHSIATASTLMMGWTAISLGDNEKAEGLLRQALQIQLNTLGPRSHETLISMDYLGNVLGRQLKYSEAEKLIRTAVQLRHECTELGGESDLSIVMNELSQNLCLQGLYKESEDVASHVIERFEGPLGPEHPFILRTRSQLARSLAQQGQYRQSGDIFRTVLKQQSKLLGESHPSTLITAWGVAGNLYGMGHIEEATIWYEKILWGGVGVYGPDSEDTILSCDALRNCYEKQGRYDDAMKLCQQLVERIQAVKGNDHPAITKLQGWIEETQNLLLEEEEDMSGEETDYLSEEAGEYMSGEEAAYLSEEEAAYLSEEEEEDMSGEETGYLSEEGDEGVRDGTEEGQ